MQRKAAAFITNATASHGVAEAVLLEQCKFCCVAPVEPDLQAKPFLFGPVERDCFDRKCGVQQEMEADGAAMAIGRFPESGQIFGVRNRSAEIEASIFVFPRKGIVLLRRGTIRCGLRTGFAGEQDARRDGSCREPSSDHAARDVEHDAHEGIHLLVDCGVELWGSYCGARIVAPSSLVSTAWASAIWAVRRDSRSRSS